MATSYVTVPNDTFSVGCADSVFADGITIYPPAPYAGMALYIVVGIINPWSSTTGSGTIIYANPPTPDGLTRVATDLSNKSLQIFVYRKTYTDDEVANSTYPTYYRFTPGDNSQTSPKYYARWASAQWTFNTDLASGVPIYGINVVTGKSSAKGTNIVSLASGTMTSVAFAIASTPPANAPLYKVNDKYNADPNNTFTVGSFNTSVAGINTTYDNAGSYATSEFIFDSTPDAIAVVQFARTTQSSYVSNNSAETATLGAITNANQGTPDPLTVSKAGSATLVTTNVSPINGAQSYRATTATTSDVAVLTGSAPSRNYPGGSIRFSARNLGPSMVILSEPASSQDRAITLVSVNASGNIVIVNQDTGILANSSKVYTFDFKFRTKYFDSSINYTTISIFANVYDHSVSTSVPAQSISTFNPFGQPYTTNYVFDVGPKSSVADVYLDDIIIRDVPEFVGPPINLAYESINVGLVGVAVTVSVATGVLPVSIGLIGAQPLHWYESTDEPTTTVSAVGTSIMASFTMGQGYYCTGARYYKSDSSNDGKVIRAALWLLHSSTSNSTAMISVGSRVQQASDPIGWIDIPWNQEFPLFLPSSTTDSYAVEISLPVSTSTTPQQYAVTSGSGSVSNNGISAYPNYRSSYAAYGPVGPNRGSAGLYLSSPSSYRFMVDANFTSAVYKPKEVSWLNRYVVQNLTQGQLWSFTVPSSYGNTLIAIGTTNDVDWPELIGWNTAYPPQDTAHSGSQFAVFSTTALDGNNTFSARNVSFMVVYEFPAGSFINPNSVTTSKTLSAAGNLTPVSVSPSNDQYINTLIAAATYNHCDSSNEIVTWANPSDVDLIDHTTAWNSFLSIRLASQVFDEPKSFSPSLYGYRALAESILSNGGVSGVNLVAFSVYVTTSQVYAPITVGLVGQAHTVGVASGILSISTGVLEDAPIFYLDGYDLTYASVVTGITVGKAFTVKQDVFTDNVRINLLDSAPPYTYGDFVLAIWNQDDRSLITQTVLSIPYSQRASGWHQQPWPTPIKLNVGTSYLLTARPSPNNAFAGIALSNGAVTINNPYIVPASGWVSDSLLTYSLSVLPDIPSGEVVALLPEKVPVAYVMDNGTGYIYMYNPSTEKWINSFTIPIPGVTFKTFKVTNAPSYSSYLFSAGISQDGSVYPDSYVYVPYTGSWTKSNQLPNMSTIGFSPNTDLISIGNMYNGTSYISIVKIDGSGASITPVSSSGVTDTPIQTGAPNADYDTPLTKVTHAISWVTSTDMGVSITDGSLVYSFRRNRGSWLQIVPSSLADEPKIVLSEPLVAVAIGNSGRAMVLKIDTADYESTYLDHWIGTVPDYPVVDALGDSTIMMGSDTIALKGSGGPIFWSTAKTRVQHFASDAPTAYQSYMPGLDIDTRLGGPINENAWIDTVNFELSSVDGSNMTTSYIPKSTDNQLLMIVASNFEPRVPEGWSLVSNSGLSNPTSIYSMTEITSETITLGPAFEPDTSQRQYFRLVGTIFELTPDTVFEYGEFTKINSVKNPSRTTYSDISGSVSVTPEHTSSVFFLLSHVSKHDGVPTALWSGDADAAMSVASPGELGRPGLMLSIAATPRQVLPNTPVVDSFSIFDDDYYVPNTLYFDSEDEALWDEVSTTYVVLSPNTSLTGATIDVGLVGVASYVPIPITGAVGVNVSPSATTKTVAYASGQAKANVYLTGVPTVVMKASGTLPFEVRIHAVASAPIYSRSASLPIAVGTIGAASIAGKAYGVLPIATAIGSSKEMLVRLVSGSATIEAGMTAIAKKIYTAHGELPVTIAMNITVNKTIIKVKGQLGVSIDAKSSDESSVSLNYGYSRIHLELNGDPVTIVGSAVSLPSDTRLVGKAIRVYAASGTIPANAGLRASHYLVREAQKIKSSTAVSFYDGEDSAQSYLTSGDDDD